MVQINHKYVGDGGFNGLPQGDIDAEAFDKLSVHRRHIVLHSGHWVATEAGGELINPYKDMKRDELNAAAVEAGVDPSGFERADDLRAALWDDYQKGAK